MFTHDICRAIQESLKISGISKEGEPEPTIEATTQARSRPSNHMKENDEELQIAMAMSQQQLEQDERLRQQEEEELRKVIELSMTEK